MPHVRYRLGDHGPAVAEIRAKLAVLGLLPDEPSERAADLVAATFDEACDRAVRTFQQQRGLSVDGVVGRETYLALDEARWRLGDRVLFYAAGRPFAGDDVAVLQQRLLDMGFDAGRADGIFGAATESALRDFQQNYGLATDGTCGPATLRALDRLTRTVKGGSATGMRESEVLHRSGITLANKLVILDPGHGGEDRGHTANGLHEAEIVEDIAARIEGRLTAAGVSAFLTRGAEPFVEGDDAPLSDAERASFANAAEADLLISLHVDGDADPSCHGVATFYYGALEAPAGPGGPGQRNAVSPVGERFADLVQREVVARTDLLDCRTHPKTWELLRRTRMPAVRLEVGYLTNPSDAERLAAAEFRDSVAEAVVAAVQRLYLPPDDDTPTGTIRITAGV